MLEQANIHEFVRTQPLGLATAIGEQSSTLSVGQAQRIALARALAQASQVFILDEPSASLDSVSEQLLTLTLNRAMAGKMCIMVTHRLDQLDRMQSILVLDKGLIVQRGDFATLSVQAGLFQTMLHENTESVADIELAAVEPQSRVDIQSDLIPTSNSTEGAAQ